MKRLDEIPKKTLFEVPEGYFDQLPGRIQARISEPEPQVAWGRLSLRYAMPLIIAGAVATFLLTNRPEGTPEEVIASIESEQLVAYLGETEINADDILDAVMLESIEVESLELDAIDDLELDEGVFGELEGIVVDSLKN